MFKHRILLQCVMDNTSIEGGVTVVTPPSLTSLEFYLSQPEQVRQYPRTHKYFLLLSKQQHLLCMSPILVLSGGI